MYQGGYALASIDESTLRLMKEASLKKKVENEESLPSEKIIEKESPLRKNSVFLGKVVDSPMAPSIEMQILKEIRRTNRLLTELRNIQLGIPMTFEELTKVEVMTNGE